MTDHHARVFPDAEHDRETARTTSDTAQTRAPAYRLAFTDQEFILRDELRPVRLQLELLKPEMELAAQGVDSTVVMFGGSRIPRPEAAGTARTPALATLSHFHDEARAFARAITARSLAGGGREMVVVTGGGPGVMEAGNRGAEEAGGRSIGLSIVLPNEPTPNVHVTPELCFNFHYFGIRKMHFLMRAAVIAVFPGGFGTLDELFETLTLVQTGRMARLPIILFGRDFWERIVNWQALAEAGTIDPGDLALFRYVETAEEALAAMDAWRDGTG